MKPKSKTYKKQHPNQSQITKKITTKPSDFASKIIQIAVSQICQSVGYKSTQFTALETLTHIAKLYLETLAKTAASYSNASNRTQSNLFDLINAFHDLSYIQGFMGGSTLHTNANFLTSSSVLKDLSFFVSSTNEIPFAKPIPRRKSILLPMNSDYLDLESRGKHIPKWLPWFPEESTYKKCHEMVGDNNRRRGDLVLWENSVMVQSCSDGNGTEIEGISRGNKKQSGGIDRGGGGGGVDLVMERTRVKFKIGDVEKKGRRNETRSG